MHPAPPEASNNATSVDQSQLPPPPTQHGLSEIEQLASGGSLSWSSPRVPTSAPDEADNLSVSSRGTRRGRSANAGRISSRETSSQEGSPGSRIDEYERAHAQLRKRSDGIIFQIVPSAKGKIQTLSIESFPNGAMRYSRNELLLTQLQRSSLIFFPIFLRKPCLQ